MRTKAKYRFIEFLRPDAHWPFPYTLEQTFEVFRWMVRTGASYERAVDWGMNGPIELLSAAPCCRSFGRVSPIRGLDDLRQRFHFALLSNRCTGGGTDAWRRDHGISPTGERILHLPHRTPFEGALRWRCEADIVQAYRNLTTEARRRDVNRPLNPCHPDCRACQGVAVHVAADRYRFVLSYGDQHEGRSSSWYETLAETIPGETFVDGLSRACVAFDALTEPALASA